MTFHLITFTFPGSYYISSNSFLIPSPSYSPISSIEQSSASIQFHLQILPILSPANSIFSSLELYGEVSISSRQSPIGCEAISRLMFAQLVTQFSQAFSPLSRNAYIVGSHKINLEELRAIVGASFNYQIPMYVLGISRPYLFFFIEFFVLQLPLKKSIIILF